MSHMNIEKQRRMKMYPLMPHKERADLNHVETCQVFSNEDSDDAKLNFLIIYLARQLLLYVLFLDLNARENPNTPWVTLSFKGEEFLAK